MIVKDLGDLRVMICDYCFKDGKDAEALAKAKSEPHTPIRCMNIKRKDLENGYFVNN